MTVIPTQVELHIYMMLHLVGDDQYRHYIVCCNNIVYLSSLILCI